VNPVLEKPELFWPLIILLSLFFLIKAGDYSSRAKKLETTPAGQRSWRLLQPGKEAGDYSSRAKKLETTPAGQI
jgi:hypothetical protein